MSNKFYSHSEPKKLDKIFYERFDEFYSLNKADVLMIIAENLPKIKETFKDKWKIESPEEHFLQSIRAEIYFTTIHMSEATFALLFAPFQGLTHWLYLTTYKTIEIKKKIKKYLKNKIADLTHNEFNNKREFINTSVYANFNVKNDTHRRNWNKNLDNIIWMLNRIGNKYLESKEYNAYKHGLRVMTGETSLAINPDDQPEKAFYIEKSKDSLSFLEVKNINGKKVLYETIKHFSHYEAYNYIFFMYKLLKTIKATRKCILKGEEGTDLEMFFSLDRKKVTEQSVSTQWTFTI